MGIKILNFKRLKWFKLLLIPWRYDVKKIIWERRLAISQQGQIKYD
jgi:hypothetical protein